jgi:hypothetical protein
MNYPDHYLNMAISHLGLTGARSHRTYELMCETWINPAEPVPSEQECKNIFDTYCRPAIHREELINYISELSFTRRAEIVPDYKLSNASLGVYGEEIKQVYANLVEAFRNEFYRVKGLLEQATTIEEMDTIMLTLNYPAGL